jgi:NADH-quinone oxidoreductase subunit J
MTTAFLILAIVTMAGVAAAMSMRHLIHCVLALTLGFVGLAMLYLQLEAQFVGLTQLLVYVGGVAILAVFAIMTTHSSEPGPRPGTGYWVGGSVVAAAVFVLLAHAIDKSGVGERTVPIAPVADVRQIGEALMSSYVLPLEIVGLLLTAALVGAVVVASDLGSEKR